MPFVTYRKPEAHVIATSLFRRSADFIESFIVPAMMAADIEAFMPRHAEAEMK